MKAKKSFGQHFLINEHAAQSIVDALDIQYPQQKVLEIGPGKGVLTKYLLSKDIKLKIVEADRDMVTYLKENLDIQKEDIIFLDFLKLNLKKAFDNKEFLLIGNYPYNISSQIVFKMLKHKNLIPQMVGMFQREVAERIVAEPGSKIYGVVSVLTQAFYSGKIILKIGPGSFSPPPKVNSAVIKLIRKDNQKLACDHRFFRTVVKTGFNQRRKMLRNTLKGIVKNPSLLENSFFRQRPEELSVEQFVQLTTLIQESNGAF